MKVTVTISNMHKSLYLTLDDVNNEAVLNGRKIDLDVPPFISKLTTIISSWERKMVNEMILDGESYSVTVENNGKVYKYEGMNKFPLNYREFKDLLRSKNMW